MSNAISSPWVRHWEPLLDAETIRQRATVTVPPLLGLASMPLELACDRLDQALKTIFHPTTQCLAVLQRLVGAAHAHCMASYPDNKTFLDGVYAEDPPLRKFVFPICLTGLAGTGKTELLKAFGRLYDGDQRVTVDPLHSPFLISGSRFVTVQACSSPKDLLRPLSPTEGTPAEMIRSIRKRAYRDGWFLLLADEFQFATGSDSANARVTQMLLSLGYIGLPLVYAANFSLITRLQRRPGEEQHRLLADPIVLIPDCAGSADWQHTLAAQRDVAPEIFVFNPAGDAESLHADSGGRKRAMAKLLLLAFRAEYHRGGRVDREAIHRAYLSTEYAGFREETEILATQANQSRAHPKRKDLWCPIPLTGNVATAFLESAIAAREQRVADAELTAALTREEKRGAGKIQRNLNKHGPASGQVVPLPRKSKATAADLKRNAGLFRDNL